MFASSAAQRIMAEDVRSSTPRDAPGEARGLNRDGRSLASLPEAVLSDALLPHLDARSLARLGATSRAFRGLVCGDAAEPSWRSLLQHDLRFPVHKTSRTVRSHGWKHLYERVLRSKLYVRRSALRPR